jgi:hypothetical protein
MCAACARDCAPARRPYRGNMTARWLPLLLPLLLAAGSARAATLAEAIHQWTGVTPDVAGRGEHVTVTLPPTSPVPAFTATARRGDRAGDPGWELSGITLPQPTRLGDGDLLTARTQAAQAWLGERTVQAQANYTGIAIRHEAETTRLDSVAVSLDGTGGPVAVELDAGAMHLDHPGDGVAPLLPRNLTLRGHTTPEGATALNAMMDGRRGGPLPVTVDRASLDVGPAHLTGTGSVTIYGPRDRRGELTISAEHFKQLMQQMPMEGAAARTYPVMMILRQMGEKNGDQLTWTVSFDGPRVLVGGIDIGPLLGW